MKKLISILCSLLCLCVCLTINAEGFISVKVEGDVEGYVSKDILAQVVTLTLDPSAPDASFTDIEVGDYVTSWFTNIPKGLTAVVDEFITDSSIKVEFNGNIDDSVSTGTTQIELNIPEGYVKYGLNVYPDSLANTPSNDARYIIDINQEFIIQYHRDYEIKGEVGKKLEPQTIVVEIMNGGIEEDDFDYENILGVELPTVNGLTPTITDYDEFDLTITITYTGTPIKESHDLIHTTILKENTLNKTTDRVVPDRIDVLFNIIDNTEEPTPEPPIDPKPIRPIIPPKTGVN